MSRRVGRGQQRGSGRADKAAGGRLRAGHLVGGRCADCMPQRPRSERGVIAPPAVRIEGAGSARPGAESGQSQIDGAFTPVAAGFDVEGDLLVVAQTGQARALDSRDVDENVLGAAFRLDEAEALGCIEPFHGAIGHVSFP